jgi:hypothetical protein
MCWFAEALREVKSSHRLDDIQHHIIGGASHVTIANEFHKNGAARHALVWLQARMRQVQLLALEGSSPSGQTAGGGSSEASVSVQVAVKPIDSDTHDDELDPAPHEPDTLMERALP